MRRGMGKGGGGRRGIERGMGKGGRGGKWEDDVGMYAWMGDDMGGDM